MTITDWLPEDRPREKLLAHGASSLSDAELLAIFLRVGIPGKTAVDLANELVAHFGSLSALFNANPADLMQVKGIGEAKYVQLQAVLEMSRRALSDQLTQASAFKDIASLKHFVQLHLSGLHVETLIVLFLSSTLSLITLETMSIGDTATTQLPTREIAKKALSFNAHGVILAHNHPFGDAHPSQEDLNSTYELYLQLKPLNIFVHDHIIVADGQAAFSMVENGVYNPY